MIYVNKANMSVVEKLEWACLQTELHSEAQPITQSEIAEEKVEHNQSNAGF